MIEFARYAGFYDRLYADKPYASEARYVHGLLQQYGIDGNRVLDVGCGTGRHAAELLSLGYQVTGLDRSTDMLELASKHRSTLPAQSMDHLEFINGSIQSFHAKQPFDAVTALFHVLSYQVSDTQLQEALDSVAGNLVPGGLFVFDFWHAPGVLADPPARRVRRIDDPEFTGTRVSTPTHDPEKRQVQVDFELNMVARNSGEKHRVTETHLMRYFGVPELESALAASGLSMLSARRWLGSAQPGEEDWYACVVARKN